MKNAVKIYQENVSLYHRLARAKPGVPSARRMAQQEAQRQKHSLQLSTFKTIAVADTGELQSTPHELPARAIAIKLNNY